MYRHGLRSAVTPGGDPVRHRPRSAAGGVVVTETVFSLPGLGQRSIDAINPQDLPVIIGLVMLASAVIVAANILVDIAYAVLDPRVRLA